MAYLDLVTRFGCLRVVCVAALLANALAAHTPPPCGVTLSLPQDTPLPPPGTLDECKATDSLRVASALGCLQRVQELLTEPMAPDEVRESLMAAIKSGRVKIVEILARRGLDAELLQAGWTGLCEATNKWTFALEINQAFLRILLEQGEPPEPTEGCLPLAVAARFGKPEMVEQIFGYGAALEVRDGSGKTPLHLAVAANQYRIVRLLLEHGADVNTTDERFGSAPIESSFDDRYITRLLINGGADVNVQSRLGSTALRSATIYNQVPVIKELINAGVDVNQRDAQGKTALFYAAKCKHVEAIALLMIAGADPNNPGYTGRNLLDVDLERAVEFVREEMERTRLQN